MMNRSADYDRWLRERIDQAVAEADSPDAKWIDHETVKRDMQAQRERLQKLIDGQS